MTNRDRVIRALQHQQPDKVPYQIFFTQKAHEKMVEYYGDEAFVSKLGNCFAQVSAEPENCWKEVEPDIWEDEFGVQWDRSRDKDIGAVHNCLVNRDNVEEFEFPDPDDPTIYARIERELASSKDGFFLVSHGFSLFERAWTLAGMETVLMAMAAEPNFINRLLDRILEYNLRIIENCCAYPIDGMRFGDDWGQQTGLLMGPRLWREFIKPRVREMYQRVKSKGKSVVIHSCGKVDEVFPDLIECGLDLFNPFQPEVMDVFEMKRIYGDRLSFYGGISTQRTLPFGTVEQTRDEVKRLLEVVGKDGGYVASPSHDIPADAKAENIAAMIDVLQNQ